MSEVDLVDRKSEMRNGKPERPDQMATRCIPVTRGMLVPTVRVPVSRGSEQA